MDDGGRRRVVQVGAGVVVALLVVAGAVVALRGSDDDLSEPAGPRARLLAVQRAGLEACRETGLSERTCAELTSDASVEPRATVAWCHDYNELIEASAGLAGIADPAADRAPLVRVVRSAAAAAAKAAPREIAKDMAASKRAIDATLDAYEQGGSRGELTHAMAAVAPDVQQAARAAADRIGSYTRAHCG